MCKLQINVIEDLCMLTSLKNEIISIFENPSNK